MTYCLPDECLEQLLALGYDLRRPRIDHRTRSSLCIGPLRRYEVARSAVEDETARARISLLIH